MIFLIGLLISFLGQLPIGVINLYVLKIAAESKPKYAVHFSIGVALVEMIYLILTLFFFNKILLKSTLYFWLQIFVVVVFVLLAFWSFIKWRQDNYRENKVDLSTETANTNFIKGIFISALNLAQFPFWILWTAYLTNLNLLQNQNLGYQVFTLGTGFGTVAGMCVYIYGGKFFFNKIQKLQRHLQLIIGLFFLLAAFVQIVSLIK